MRLHRGARSRAVPVPVPGGQPRQLRPLYGQVLDDLYEKQSRTIDPAERKRLIRAFEKRLLDDETHYVPTLQYHRIIPHSAKVRGWTITPSHYINQQLDTVWLAQ
jgi:ABC-type transport system substrate-binding protein